MEHGLNKYISPNEPLFNAPIHVDFDMTNACNLACSHCHSASGKRQRDELSSDEIKKVIGELHHNGVIDLTIAGGEPFLRPDLSEILAYAYACRGIYTTVVTNGTLLNRETVRKLASDCRGVNFNISIDGSSPNSLDILRHRKKRDKNTKNELFSQIIAGAKAISDAGLTLGISFVVSNLNYDDLENVYDLAVNELGANSITAIRFFPAGFGKDSLSDLALSYEDWENIILRLTRKHDSFSKLNISVSAPWEIYLPLLNNGYTPQRVWEVWQYKSTLTDPVYASEYELGDASGIADLNIHGNGDVYPSVLMSGNNDVLCGNIRHQSLRDIWYKSTHLKKLRSIRLAEIGEPCLTCQVRELCGAGSRSRALSLTGSIYGLDYWCPIISASLRKKSNVIALQKQ